MIGRSFDFATDYHIDWQSDSDDAYFLQLWRESGDALSWNHGLPKIHLNHKQHSKKSNHYNQNHTQFNRAIIYHLID